MSDEKGSAPKEKAWNDKIIGRLETIGGELADCEQMSHRLTSRIIGDQIEDGPPTGEMKEPVRAESFVGVVGQELDRILQAAHATKKNLRRLLGESD